MNLKLKLSILATITLAFILILSVGRILHDINTKKIIEAIKTRIIETGAISRVIHYMQIERGATLGIIGKGDALIDDNFIDIKQNLDRSIQNAKEIYSKTAKTDEIISVLNELESQRKNIDFLSMSAYEVKDYYSSTIEILHDFIRTFPNQIEDKENRNSIQAYIYLSSAKESLGQIRAIVNNVLNANHFSDRFYISLIENLKTYSIYIDNFKVTAPKQVKDLYDDKYKGESVTETFKTIEMIIQNKESLDFIIEPSYWFEKSTNAIDIIQDIDDTIFERLNKSIDKELSLIFYKMTAIAVLLIAVFISLAFLMTLAIKEILSSTSKLKKENLASKRELEDSISLLEQYKLAVDRSFIVSKTNARGVISYVNNAFCKISGYTRAELINMPHNIVRHPDMPKEIFQEMWHTLKNLKKPWFGDIKNLNKNGTFYWANTVINPIVARDGNIIEYIAIRVDITKMKHALTTDLLTGHPNRLKLNEDIKRLQNLSLCIFNIDNFRQINDFYGHEFGDLVIKSIANNINRFIADDDNLNFYKLNGDEFVVLSTAYNSAHFKAIITKTLAFLKNIKMDKEGILISFTCGISFEDKEHLISAANMALKVAKKSNVDFLVYSEDISLNRQYENNITWTRKLSNALREKNITTYYQPIVNNSDLSYEKYECLVRMKDGKEIVSPFYFLDIAKQTRQYFDITRTVLYQAFEMFKEKDIEFSVNLSFLDIIEPKAYKYIISMLNKYDIGSRVVFEIVETELIDEFEAIMNFIDEVKKYGCKIAIDDFGTGYSNFNYLIKLKADYLKIDGSIIKNIDKDENAFLVVSTIVEFSKKLGMKTVAEFVESEEIFKIVRELGIDYSQGYYFSEPKKDILKLSI